MTTATKTTHNHDNGQALPFGQRKPVGECPRCDELRDGARPRTWRGTDRKAEDAARAAEQRQHIASGECARKCGPMPTCYQW